MNFQPLSWLGAALLGGAVVLGGCNFGGLNDAIHKPGDEPGGVQIAQGNLAVSPTGDYFLFDRDGKLAIGWVATGVVEDLPVVAPARLAFSKERRFVYVTTSTSSVYAVDIDARAVAWSRPVGSTLDPLVVSSTSDTRVAVGGGLVVDLFDAATGEVVASHPLSRPIVDLTVLPDDERLLAVEGHVWAGSAPSTTVVVMDLAAGDTRDIVVPNCSDHIVVPKSGGSALLAPTTCQKDPISTLDLTPGAEKFVKNLPGFGPVALGPDGETAVGFLDHTKIDATLFEDPADIPADPTRYQLMVIDTSTMAYEFYPWGEAMPRYAMTPNGQVLLVDEWLTSGSARLFDLAGRVFEAISGPAATFEELVFSADSSHAYVLSDPVTHAATSSTDIWTDYELFALDLGGPAFSALTTDFRPRNVNIAPASDKLFLRRDAASVCVYDLATQTCDRLVDLATM
ncbi:MAG: hypothetical protein IT373_01630 [Polyangiaceae bacterium]|nr:hypothetical protein [Polyangiaceae bacterium]